MPLIDINLPLESLLGTVPGSGGVRSCVSFRGRKCASRDPSLDPSLEPLSQLTLSDTVGGIQVAALWRTNHAEPTAALEPTASRSVQVAQCHIEFANVGVHSGVCRQFIKLKDLECAPDCLRTAAILLNFFLITRN